jgi:GNAT superfamily N-acetyltransferase
MQTIQDLARQDYRTSHDSRVSSPIYTESFEVEIIAYEPQYRGDFKRLNLEWIETLFTVEPLDTILLSDPETYFLQPGGAIWFAQCCTQIVGTCALLKHPDRGFELSKMGVTRLYRGVGIGRKLVESALEQVKSLGARTIFLETHSRLVPAMRLYQKFGFQIRTYPQGRPKRYVRADTYMVLEW